jgi:hypothetical protein
MFNARVTLLRKSMARGKEMTKDRNYDEEN